MDEQGVHSPTNAKRFTVSDNKDTASPDQTVAGKDTSNSFMAVTLPKSEGEGSSSRHRLSRSFIQGQDKHVITPPNPDPNGDRLVLDIERNKPNTSPRNTNNNITRSNSQEKKTIGNIHIIKMLNYVRTI
ncbi:hypothetical protein H5410_058855 [Solanum commersonii]|uniref:Uncharacterized protein n=1 Tax=Solanum commersonii TaxID=4109 RepID=A0A9J5W0Z4_SOLCO|nr:hypothetical protein H5410_058855 [Solanum commersonii]